MNAQRLLTGFLTTGICTIVGCTHAASDGADDGPSGARTDASSTSVLRPASDIAWTPCGTAGGECATIRVPIDWAHPEGETFELAIGRKLALEPENRIGVLFLNPGGPGSSGIDAYITGQPSLDTSILRKRFDLVSWDPRGVARSHPVVCDADLFGQYDFAFPTTERAYRERIAFNAKLGENCRAHTGPLFDHVDTLSTVRDMDAIRNALGEEKLNYLGISYGTLIGQQYAEEFPARIRAMAIESNMDHSVTSTFRYLQMYTEDLEKSFLAFVDWCGRTPTCKLHGRDVAAIWDQLYEKATAGTLIDPKTGGALELAWLRFNLQVAIIAPSRWPGLAERIASLESGVPLSASARGMADERLLEAGYQPILCQDWKFEMRSFQEFDAYRRILEAMYPHTRMTIFWTQILDCLGFPVKVNNPQHRLSAPDAPPTLVVTSRYDPLAPHDGGVAVHRQLKGSVLLQDDNFGHIPSVRSLCARQTIETYLTTRVMPPKDAHCPAEFPEEAPPSMREAPPP
ncbi:alpha/beta hydrolase [Pendulispora rubella]|uniref:Alpha/beta hydrolase n=1 Tax=Pendulispora rubella TaxID=2741070 RepID=A0ABZ2KQ06_9BACT